MDWSAHNAGFVIFSYVISGLCLAGLGIMVVWRDRKNTRAINKLKE